MKNKIQKTNDRFLRETKDGETTDVMETVLFTDTIRKEIKGLSPMRYSDCIPLVAAENKIKVFVNKCGLIGSDEDIEKIQDLLINSVLYN